MDSPFEYQFMNPDDEVNQGQYDPSAPQGGPQYDPSTVPQVNQGSVGTPFTSRFQYNGDASAPSEADNYMAPTPNLEVPTTDSAGNDLQDVDTMPAKNNTLGTNYNSVSAPDPTKSQYYQALQAGPPQRSDYQPSALRKILGGLAGGIIGVKNPQLGMVAEQNINNVPYSKAVDQYQQNLAAAKGMEGQEENAFEDKIKAAQLNNQTLDVTGNLAYKNALLDQGNYVQVAGKDGNLYMVNKKTGQAIVGPKVGMSPDEQLAFNNTNANNIAQAEQPGKEAVARITANTRVQVANIGAGARTDSAQILADSRLAAAQAHDQSILSKIPKTATGAAVSNAINSNPELAGASEYLMTKPGGILDVQPDSMFDSAATKSKKNALRQAIASATSNGGGRASGTGPVANPNPANNAVPQWIPDPNHPGSMMRNPAFKG